MILFNLSCERNPGNNNNQCIIYVRNLIATFNLPVHCRSVAGQYLQVTYTCLSNTLSCMNNLNLLIYPNILKIIKII